VVAAGYTSSNVAMGGINDRFIGKVLAGDLDGKLWAFDVSLDANNVPQFSLPSNPIPSSLANPATLGTPLPIVKGLSIVPVTGWSMYIIFAQGNDRLPTWCMGGIGVANPNLIGCSLANPPASGGTSVGYNVVSFYDQNTGAN